MDTLQPSRSAQRRWARSILDLAEALLALPAAALRDLPAAAELKALVAAGQAMKPGAARRRQAKTVASLLRASDDLEGIALWQAQRQGHRREAALAFQELERQRNAILAEAYGIARHQTPERGAPAPALASVQELASQLPSLDARAVEQAAWRHARTGHPSARRQVLQLLRAAHERLRLAAAAGAGEEPPGCAGGTPAA
ncbi:MAG: DUF615 domain-containing protein [Thermodesulfobacteriota bacterium]